MFFIFLFQSPNDEDGIGFGNTIYSLLWACACTVLFHFHFLCCPFPLVCSSWGNLCSRVITNLLLSSLWFMGILWVCDMHGLVEHKRRAHHSILLCHPAFALCHVENCCRAISSVAVTCWLRAIHDTQFWHHKTPLTAFLFRKNIFIFLSFFYLYILFYLIQTE